MLRSVSLGGSLCDAFSLVTGLRRTGQRAEGRSDQRGALDLAFCPASVESESKRGDGEGLREEGGREGPSPAAPRRAPGEGAGESWGEGPPPTLHERGPHRAVH